MKLQLIKNNQNWKTYEADEFKILYRNKVCIAWDNESNPY